MKKPLKIVIFLLFFAVLPSIIIIPLIIQWNRPVLSILPSSKYYNKGSWSYADNASKVNSYQSDENKIIMEYTLNGNRPLVLIGFNLEHQFPFLDLSRYEELRLKISVQKASNFGITIKTFEPGISKMTKDLDPLRENGVEIKINKLTDTYRIPLKSLKAQDWWIARYNTYGRKLYPKPLLYSVFLQITFYDKTITGEQDKVELNEVVFYPASDFTWIILFAATVFYYLVSGTILFIRYLWKKTEKNRQKMLLSYKKIDQISYKDSDTNRIQQYIIENYFNPDITIEGIVSQTGVAQKKIAQILQKEYRMTFKECVNWLRMEEAKRLLIKTDLNITEIAFKLGYNSNSYFGALFKSREHLSPKEYREKNSRT